MFHTTSGLFVARIRGVHRNNDFLYPFCDGVSLLQNFILKCNLGISFPIGYQVGTSLYITEAIALC